MPRFDRYLGIDYSGAETPTSSLKGLRVYAADWLLPPTEVPPPPSPRRYWTRRGLAEWLVAQLNADRPTLVGIDHGFSFPLPYFKKHHLPLEWPAFLDDFHRHWPTDGDHVYVDFVRDGLNGQGHSRQGNSRWRRLTELRTGSAKSVFHFDCPGSVAKSTHAGLPWLRFIRQRCPQAHFWPFDGWDVPPGKSVLAEAYPALWMRDFARDGRNDDQQAAYAVAEALRQADIAETLLEYFSPQLDTPERAQAAIEGWILGVK